MRSVSSTEHTSIVFHADQLLCRESISSVSAHSPQASRLRRTRRPLRQPSSIQSQPSRRQRSPEVTDRFVDESLAYQSGEIQVRSRKIKCGSQSSTLLSAAGLSHALGHKLGAAYSIPHGITSVRPPPVLLPIIHLTSTLVFDSCAGSSAQGRDSFA